MRRDVLSHALTGLVSAALAVAFWRALGSTNTPSTQTAQTITVEPPKTDGIPAFEEPVDVASPLSSAGPASDEIHSQLRALAQRVADLEAQSRSRRSAVPSEAELPEHEELRGQVLEWVHQDRIDQQQRQAQSDAEQRLREMEYDARYQALMFAKEHDLEPWARAKWEALTLETLIRAEEIQRQIDVRIDDPDAVEARWEEFDAWVDERERALTAEISPELYAEMYDD